MKKGMIGIAKMTFIFTVLIASIFLICSFIPALAEGASAWTADSNGQAKYDFSPEEKVFIMGENFSLWSTVNISITNPNGLVGIGSETTDPFGAFEYEYDLAGNGIMGVYNVSVTDGMNMVLINFNDSTGRIWTTKGDCGGEQQDVNQYDVGEHVYINGAGFGSGSKSWSIKGNPGSCDSNIVVASGTVSGASFCFDAYNVQVGDCGVYKADVDKKNDNYQVGDYCGGKDTEKKCGDSSGCFWCDQCKYEVSTTKTNQWLAGKCVVEGTDCGFHCEKNYCGATCSDNNDCQCQADKCVGSDYYDYPTNGECKDCTTSCYCNNGEGSGQPCKPTVTHDDPRCTSCSKITCEGSCNSNSKCEWCSQCSSNPGLFSGDNSKCVDKGGCTRSCVIGKCGATCNSVSCSSKCDGNVRKYSGSCDLLSTCTCSYLSENCDSYDGWYDTGSTKWVSTGQCSEKEQKEQSYREYKCSSSPSVACTFDVTDTQWVDTGNARNKDDGASCEDGSMCTVDDVCKSGVCGGSPKDCSSINGQCQNGFCNPADGQCYPDYFKLSTPCDSNDACKINHCDGSGSCVLNYNLNCDDSNKCTLDSCDSNLGCQNTPVDCDDANACTLDSCSPTEGCMHTPIEGCCLSNSDCSGLDTECAVGVCNQNKCEYSFKPSDTSCEADQDKCTIDHCDGSGSCVFEENVLVPQAEQCKSFYCDPSDGQVKEDYSNFPLSTPCEADGQFCTVDQCNGEGSCVFLKDYECSIFNLGEIASCGIVPDDNLFTFDYAAPFTSQCDEDNNECTTGSQTLTHTCADADSNDGGPAIPAGNGIRTCDAECDGFGPECQNKCIGDVRYFTGSCDLGSCSCSYSTEDCNKDGCYAYESGCEDRDYSCAAEGCQYTQSNRNTDYYDDYASYCSGSTIRKHRTLHDYGCNGECSEQTSWVDDQLVEDCDQKDGWYDTTSYQWVSTGECAQKEQIWQEYRDYTCGAEACAYSVAENRWFDTGKTGNKEDGTSCDDGLYCTTPDTCDAGVCSGPARACSSLNGDCQEGACSEALDSCVPDYANFPLSTPCEADDDICTIDHCDGSGSCVFEENVPAPNVPVKVIGEPKTECQDGEWCEWKVTMITPIKLSCDSGKVKWRYALDGDWNEWNTDDSPVTIYFPEESNHTLEAYCSSECGESSHDIEKIKVEGTAFNIDLHKKWNLISVPFVLINDDPDEVFKDVKDDIASVWTYDNGVWYSWTPQDGGTLDSIKPGWGYWILAKDDATILLAGSLFSPITPPPSKDLKQGWNLIGYYGTEWQTYQLESDSCGNDYKYSNLVYCSLNSLIDTQQGFPRWSSLWGYDNCGNDVTSWQSLVPCNSGLWSDTKMSAGKGYWIEMDVNDGYAPASNCIFNEELECSAPNL